MRKEKTKFNKKSHVLMISVAINNYDLIYGQCIESQNRYSKKFGYDYLLVNKPKSASITASAWLKIPLIIEALENGYEWVFYVDADCMLSDSAPKIESLDADGKLLYMANGFSGRVNSGVIVVKNSPNSIELFNSIYSQCDEEVPSADWGENGHVIYFTKKWDFLQIVSPKWNNNSDPKLNDYIRHFSAGGPMRPLYPATLFEKIIAVAQKIKNKLDRKKYLPRNIVSQETKKLFCKARIYF